ncbi:hypothetical protein PT974_06305 [Cladobotryum mycophilum]|uniref:Uncharacterized protein n=1 Tax=Cladobotryum mycophilum TaxID=491253 RepID=A0ABR0SL82_9HYPO
MLTASLMRRNLAVAILFVSLLVIGFYSQPYVDTERFINSIPYTSKNLKASSSHAHAPSPPPEPLPEPSLTPVPSSDDVESLPLSPPPPPAQEPIDTKPVVKTSRLHYLIPASQPNLHFCYNLASSLVNRFPVPILLGWHGVDEFDAAKTHLAKLRAVERYFNTLPPEEDDDLVIIVDGYDILMQLPAEIMVERYFELAARADARLAERFGLTVEQLHDRGLRQTIFWGPDKICWPIDPRASRCWAAPASPIPREAFGLDKQDDPMFYADPRWLNSGTVMAPIGDMKRYLAATMDEIRATHDPEYEFKESDQYYLSNVWGRQEYWRSRIASNGGDVLGGPPDRIIPDKRTEDQETEYHIAIEYESALFQTRAGYQPYFGYMQFNNSDLSATQTKDVHDEGPEFQPTKIKMPTNVETALSKLYDDIPEAHPGSVASDWIRVAELGVNFITHHIYALWHCTGPKEFVGLEYPTLWFYPFVKSLLRANVKASQSGEPISSKLIDGRQWAPKTVFPGRGSLDDEYGGAWTDFDEERFVPWKVLCGAHEELLFKGEHKPAAEPL